MNLKKLATTILFICLFLSINQYAHSQNMLEQMKALHLQKKQGSITAQEFEEKKKAIVESHSPEAKKKADEEAKKLAEKLKQEKILEEQKKREAESLALKEYENKFPLHAALKKNDRAKMLELLKLPDLQINAFDNEDKTPWDIAYSLENTSVSFELCKLLKDAGAVSSKEIKEFELQKRREKLVTLTVSAGVTYQMGGYQPFVGLDMALVKSSAKYKIVGEAQACLNIFNFVVKASVDYWGAARAKLMTPVDNFIDSESLVKKASTNASGKVVFADIEPGSYLVVFGGPTRKNFGIWIIDVDCTEKETEIVLTESNAFFVD